MAKDTYIPPGGADLRLLPAGILNKNTIALNDLIDRIINLKLDTLFLYRIDKVDPCILPYLAYQLHVTNKEGWFEAVSEQEKRTILRDIFELHRYKGTVYAIKHVLRKIGIHCEIIQWYQDGQLKPGEFFTDVRLREEAITREDENEIRALITEFKNERSWLKAVRITASARQSMSILQSQEVRAYARMINTVEYTLESSVTVETIQSGTVVQHASMID